MIYGFSFLIFYYNFGNQLMLTENSLEIFIFYFFYAFNGHGGFYAQIFTTKGAKCT